MESSDLVIRLTPSAERLSWLTQWARDRGASHPFFEFTSEVAPSGALCPLLAVAVDPESSPLQRADALAGTAHRIRRGFNDLPSSDWLLRDLRLLLPTDLPLEELYGYLHVAYSVHGVRVLHCDPLIPREPIFELTERGQTVTAGCTLEFATGVLAQAYVYLERLTPPDFEAMSLQTRHMAGELLLTYYLHGGGRVVFRSNNARRLRLLMRSRVVWDLLKPHEFEAGLDDAAYLHTLSEKSFQIVCERLKNEEPERADVVANGGGEQAAAFHAEDTPVSTGGLCTNREMHVVLPGAIPPGKDPDENATIKRYSDLQGPLGLVVLPELNALTAMKVRLCGEFPWAEGAIEEIFGDLCLKRRCGVLRCQLRPTLIAGQAGVGKTRFARRLAEELGLPFRAINVGGMNDTFPLLGTSRGWTSGHPSPLLDLLASSRSPSALVLLDEVEKAANRIANSTSVTSALLGLLEPESVRRWYDTFLQTECDLSAMSFILTANSLSALPKPFLSRCHLVMFDEPRREHIQAAVPHALADLARNWGLPADVFAGYEPIARGLPVRSMRELKAVLTYQLKEELVAGASRWIQ